MSFRDFKIRNQVGDLLKAQKTVIVEKKTKVKSLINKQLKDQLQTILDTTLVRSFEEFTEEEYLKHKIKAVLQRAK